MSVRQRNMDAFDATLEGSVSRLSEHKEPGHHEFPMVCPECAEVVDVTMYISAKVGAIPVIAKHRNNGCFIKKTNSVVMLTARQFPSQMV